MPGNVVCLGPDYLSGVSDEFGARPHRHPLLEIYAACDGDSHLYTEGGVLAGQAFVIAAGTVHAIADTGKRGLAVFVDPLSETGYSLAHTVLDGRPIRTLTREPWREGLLSLAGGVSERSVRALSEQIVSGLCTVRTERPFTKPVLQVIEQLNAGDCLFDMEDLARRV